VSRLAAAFQCALTFGGIGGLVTGLVKGSTGGVVLGVQGFVGAAVAGAVIGAILGLASGCGPIALMQGAESAHPDQPDASTAIDVPSEAPGFGRYRTWGTLLAVGAVVLAAGVLWGLRNATPSNYSECIARAAVDSTTRESAIAKAQLCQMAFPRAVAAAGGHPTTTEPAPAQPSPAQRSTCTGNELVDYVDPPTGRVYRVTCAELEVLTREGAGH
jgi:hypothetical protein